MTLIEAAEDVERLLAPQYASVKRTGIDLTPILDENVEKLAPWVSRERCYLVCYTGRKALSAHELIDENRPYQAVDRAKPGCTVWTKSGPG
nr:hypothetical protein [Pseudomonas cerasi]